MRANPEYFVHVNVVSVILRHIIENSSWRLGNDQEEIKLYTTLSAHLKVFARHTVVFELNHKYKGFRNQNKKKLILSTFNGFYWDYFFTGK